MPREARFPRELALGKLQPLQRLQEHFAEPSPALEEDELGLAHACAIFRFLPHKLQRADHVRRLAKPVFVGSYLADIHIRQIGAKHGVDEVRDERLPVVVVHDDRLEALEEGEVVSLRKEPSSFASRPLSANRSAHSLFLTENVL